MGGDNLIPLPSLRYAAPELDAIADWIENELAAGTPPKWVARQAALCARYVAMQIRMTGKQVQHRNGAQPK